MWPFKKHPDSSALRGEVAKLRLEVHALSAHVGLALTRAQKALNTVAELRRELGEPTQPQEPQAAPKVKAKARAKTQASKKEIAVRHRIAREILEAKDAWLNRRELIALMRAAGAPLSPMAENNCVPATLTSLHKFADAVGAGGAARYRAKKWRTK
jgi:hypothetical protein